MGIGPIAELIAKCEHDFDIDQPKLKPRGPAKRKKNRTAPVQRRIAADAAKTCQRLNRLYKKTSTNLIHIDKDYNIVKK